MAKETYKMALVQFDDTHFVFGSINVIPGEIDINYFFLNSIGCSTLGVNVLCGLSWYALRAGGDGIEFSGVSLVGEDRDEVPEPSEDSEEKIETNNANKI